MNLTAYKSKQIFSINDSICILPNGDLLDISFEAKFDKRKIKKAYPNLWRYKDAIAINQSKGIVSLNEGFNLLH